MNNNSFTLKPEEFAAIRNLTLRAKLIVEGTIAGLHKSPFHGFSAEFLEYRSYLQGESVRKVDWRKFAKTDRAFVRLYEDETNLIAHILVDKSKSMQFKSGSAVSKFQYAITLAASITRIFIGQRDAVGMALFDDQLGSYLPPKSTNVQMERIIRTLETVKPGESTRCAKALDALAIQIRKRGMTIIISDFFDNPEEIIRGLRHLKFMKQDVLVLWILDSFETDFSGNATYRLADLESGRELVLDGVTARTFFNRGVQSHREKIIAACREMQIDCEIITTNEPYHRALFRVLEKRGRHL